MKTVELLKSCYVVPGKNIKNLKRIRCKSSHIFLQIGYPKNFSDSRQFESRTCIFVASVFMCQSISKSKCMKSKIALFADRPNIDQFARPLGKKFTSLIKISEPPKPINITNVTDSEILLNTAKKIATLDELLSRIETREEIKAVSGRLRQKSTELFGRRFSYNVGNITEKGEVFSECYKIAAIIFSAERLRALSLNAFKDTIENDPVSQKLSMLSIFLELLSITIIFTPIPKKTAISVSAKYLGIVCMAWRKQNKIFEASRSLRK